MYDWFVEFKYREWDKLYTPVDPVIPIQLDFIPGKNFGGPYHCKNCAIDCASFGKTERQAWEINHGTADEQFFGFLGSDGA
jgi:hypothetical protein